MVGSTKVSQMLGVSPPTVYKMVERGELPAYRIGLVLRFLEADIQEYLSQAAINKVVVMKGNENDDITTD